MGSLFDSIGTGAAAILMAGVILIGALFVGGRPSDAGGGLKWQGWAVAGLVILLVIFLLNRSMSTMYFN